jgi:hypothetical protein
MSMKIEEICVLVSLSRLRALIICLMIFVFPACRVSTAQTVRIQLVNGKNGRAIGNTCVNTWVGTERKDATLIPADKDGVVWLYLTDKDSEVNIQNLPKDCVSRGATHAVAKYSDTIRIVAGYALCQPHAPDNSWVATLEFSTMQIVQQGIVTANSCGKAKASPEPGKLVIFVRPLTWLEQLKQ